MNALASLIREHQIISGVVSALDAYAARLERAAYADPDDLARFAALFTDFGDCIHHEKEEGILLPRLVRSGLRWDEGVLPAVRRQHRHERYLIEVLSQASEQSTSWNREDVRRIAASARALVQFQREHHQLENGELLPIIGQRLTRDALEELGGALEKFDLHHAERYAAGVELAQQLMQRYAPELGPKPDWDAASRAPCFAATPGGELRCARLGP